MSKNEIMSIIFSNNIKFKAEFLSSIIILFLVFLVSLYGILFHDEIYSSAQNINNLATDWMNLLIIIPLFIITLWLVSKGNINGLLLWSGILFYLVFIYLFYSISISFQWTSLLYITITPLCGFTSIGIIGKMDSDEVHNFLANRLSTSLTGGLLLLFGLFFLALDLLNIIGYLSNSSTIEIDQYTALIVDFTVGIPLLLIGGILIIQKKNLGYVLSLGLLLYIILLDFGVSVLYIFKWFFNEPDFDPGALIIFSVITLICFFPIYLSYKKTQSISY